MDKAIKNGIPKDIKQELPKAKGPARKPAYNLAMALQIIITRWTRAPIKYESVFNPSPQTQQTLNIHESIRYSLEKIAQVADTKGPWNPPAYKRIQTRLGNIQTLAHIIKKHDRLPGNK